MATNMLQEVYIKISGWQIAYRLYESAYAILLLYAPGYKSALKELLKGPMGCKLTIALTVYAAPSTPAVLDGTPALGQ